MTNQTKPDSPANNWLSPRGWIIVAGGVSAALGLIVLVGWHTHTTGLIQIHPALVPMQYNTATGFLLSGLMLLAHAHKLRRAAMTLAAIVAAIGILTLVEYILAVDLGIDQLLMKHYVTVQTSHPGRMAPNTALSFSLTGIAILLSTGLMRRLAGPINGILGSLVLGLGAVALLGYLVGLETAYGWGRLTQMAIHTASGFIVLGWGLVVSGWRISRNGDEILPRWISIAAAVAVLAITVSLWLALYPGRDITALQSAHNYVLFFGIVLAAMFAWVLNMVASERAGKHRLKVEIAERRQVEEELRNYKHIVSNSTDMLALFDRRYVYIAANAAYLQAYGKTSDEVIGRTLVEVVGEEVFGKVIRPNSARCLAGEEVHYQAQFEYPASGWRHMDVLYSPYRGMDNEIRGFVASARDITEREQLHAQLVQAQKMETVGLLTGGVAHDFNNLLTVIIGNLELLEEDLVLDEEDIGFMRAALDASMRGATLTKRLLAYSRKQQLEPEITEVNRLIEGVKPLIRRTLIENISIKTRLADDLWPTVVDASQLENSIVNLAINARDAMPGGGELTIQTSNISLDESYAASEVEVTAGDYVLLAISDTGTGIPPDILSKVFDPFFTTKDTGKGSGLGLSMVYGFVKQSKGHIKAYSEEGHGTVMKVYLPRSMSDQRDTTESTPSRTEIPSGSETILVVEDEPEVRHVAVNLLRPLGYRVLEANNGAAALALIKGGEHIDLLFTDIIMPGGMTGVDLADLAHQHTPKLKVLYTSGYTDTTVFSKGMLQRGSLILNKPYRAANLANEVRSALDDVVH